MHEDLITYLRASFQIKIKPFGRSPHAAIIPVLPYVMPASSWSVPYLRVLVGVLKTRYVNE